jgi:hypothetical protein
MDAMDTRPANALIRPDVTEPHGRSSDVRDVEAGSSNLPTPTK